MCCHLFCKETQKSRQQLLPFSLALGTIDGIAMKLADSQGLLSNRSEPAFRVRIFSPKGIYPRGAIASEHALFFADEDLVFADEDLVFSVVWAEPYDQVASNFPYSEMDWATPQETRFWASILLCEDADEPKIMLYPQRYIFSRVEPPVDLTAPETHLELKSQISAEIEKRRERGVFSLLEHSLSSYSLIENDVSLERQPLFFRNIGETDHILLRGICCLIKCDMLSRYYEFAEEAAIVGFIALEASFALVVERLKRDGVSNPTARDAGKWLDDTFNRPIGIEPGERKYFEELYEQRVITMHPSSRFGDCPYAPLMHDDLFDLRNDLREVFAYLVSGSHGPEFKRRLKERGLDGA